MTRNYSAANSSDDGVSGSSSQEFSQNVYEFTFLSQDSSRCHWSDRYSLSSSQESRQVAFLSPRKSREDDVFGKSKTVKMIDVDSEPYGSCSTQDLKGFGVMEISDEDFQKSKKPKKANFDPYEYNSSEELEEIMVLPQRKGREKGVFDFSDHGDLWKSKRSKNVGSDTCVLNSSQELSDLGIPRSRKQRDGNGHCLEFSGVSGKSKKKDRGENGVLKKKKKERKSKESGPGYVELTATLMETQVFGEMTEHVDEVNFALDGLKKGQQVKTRRASFMSLLSICGTSQQRRLLRAHGMARKIIDALLGLSFDDMPSNLAAAALFYILTSDGQDDHLLYSPSCIRFLIKLLKPLSSGAAKEKSQPIGSKLLGLCKNAGLSQDSAKGTDSSSTEIVLKVREILVNCKEMKPIDDSDGQKTEPELNPKWISLLTLEKACLSSISIEDTSGILRRAGGKFKEKLRECGGLEAVFEVARKCHSVMEEWLEKSPTFILDSKNISGLESLVMLLKCLKIMENATFLSNDNQCHLLGMKGSFDGQQAPRSFTKLVLSVIRILSGVSLLRSSLSSSQDEKMGCISYGSSNSGEHCSMEWTFDECSNLCNPCLTSGPPGSFDSGMEPTAVSLLRQRAKSSQTGLCNGTYYANSVTHVSRVDSEMEFGTGKRQLTSTNSRIREASVDPFAFHEDDFEPSKWELLSGSLNKSLFRDGSATVCGYKDGSNSVPVSQQESNNAEYHHSQEASCSSAADEDKSNLLADCLLTAVKVLMNLSNDNPEGCQQIASCGGLEILSSLIAGHFPSFSLSLPHFHHMRENSLSSKSSPTINQWSNTPLTDRELDFLVAILGLLVNLVEKDGRNRSRLAAASVSVPNLEGLDSEDQSDVISILCSIFLANQGTTEAAAEEKNLSWEDEDSILQGEKEAEKMIVEAYAALLLAFLSTESKKVRSTIAECLPNHNLKILVPVLERFVEFHLTLNVISPETHSAVLEVIESCRIP